MHFSQLFGQTLRTAPAGAETASYVWLARGGYIRQLQSGDFTFLPLGQKVLNNLESLVRSELEALGAQEIGLHSGISQLAETEIQSYRQLPRILFSRSLMKSSIHPNHGLIGARTSPILKIYSLQSNAQDRTQASKALTSAITQIINNLGVPVNRIEANPGLYGTSAESLFFMTEAGVHLVVHCPACGYAAERIIARRNKPVASAEEQLPLETVSTPNCPTIDALAEYLGIPKEKTAKAVFLMADFENPDCLEGISVSSEQFIFAIVRGDMELSETKLANAIGASSLRQACNEDIHATGAEPGYASPIGIKEGLIVVDNLIPIAPNLVAGANEHGFHLRNINCGRDYQANIVTDLVLVKAGDPCPECSSALEVTTGTELAYTVQYDPSNAPNFTDENGQNTPLLIGVHHFDLGRTIAAVVETHYDDKGLIWPTTITPYDVHLITIPGKEMDTHLAADNLYKNLQKTGISVLYDDRDVRAGVKFNDADLIGLPIRMTVGERNLREGMVELKVRAGTESHMVPIGNVVLIIKEYGH